jgi:metal transporter CNNM
MPSITSNPYLARRPAVLAIAKLLFLALTQLPAVRALPHHVPFLYPSLKKPDGKPTADPSLWLYLGVAAALVLLGGAFAGLTIALMGQVGYKRIL